MKYIFTLLLAFASLTLSAQEELPLEYNPILQSAHAKKTVERKAVVNRYLSQQPNSRVVPPIDFTECVLAGDSISFCIDTTANGGGASTFNCINCNDAQFGTVSIDSTCFIYASDAATVNGIDTISFSYCDQEGLCDTFRYLLNVYRRGENIVFPRTELMPEEAANIPIDFSSLPEPLETILDLDCNDDNISEVFVAANRIFYYASRFSGSDTVCVVAQSVGCIADTLRYPFVTRQDTLPTSALPFQDDFSNGGPYPNPELWLDDDVFVNNGLGTNVPTIGVASFDGLGEDGSPYGGDYGSSDHLTSAYLNLQVPGQLYLSFFYQFKGNGYSLNPNDSLTVELKNQDGKWETVAGFTQDTFFTLSFQPKFRFIVLEVADRFKYKGFQFRFRNNSDNIGTLEPWNIDVVRLGTDVPTADFQDLAFVAPPQSVLRRYSAMPWNQFYANISGELRDEYGLAVRNNSAQIRAIANDDLSIRRFPFASSVDLLNPGSPLTGNIDALTTLNRTYNVPAQDFDDLATTLSSFSPMDQVRLVSHYEATFSASADIFTENNTTEKVTSLETYYAYDDGSAERRLTPGGNGNRLAVGYTTNVSDTLKAIQFHFPYYPGSFKGRTFKIQVFVGELDNEPEYEELFAEPLYVDESHDTLQGFTTYVLSDFSGEIRTPLFIPAGNFWVSYETNSTAIPVGFDVNTPDARQNLYFYGNQNWVRIDTASNGFQGALMIRPVFGQGQPIDSPVKEVLVNSADWSVFPNPISEGELRIDIDKLPNRREDYTLTVVSSGGQLLNRYFSVPSSISVAGMQSGWYVLQLTDKRTGQVYVRRVVVQK